MHKLDPLIHSQLRLSIMTLLMNLYEAQFSYLKEETGVAAGNLSIQLTTLENADYITTWKESIGKRSITKAKITDRGRKAYKAYLEALKDMLPL